MIIKQLTFKFHKDQQQYFFKDLALELALHKVYFMQGDNGVGKSTLFSILQGNTPGSGTLTGSVTLEGHEYRAQHNVLSEAFTKHVHTVYQDYTSMLADQFTFTENLQLACMQTYPGLCSLPDAQFLSLAQELAIPLTIPVCRLSGGQRQLLAIFMALQQPTKLLLLDEPTATLDRNNARLVMQTLHRLAAELKITMLIICHDKELVQEYAQDTRLSMQLADDGQRVVMHQ